jgi:hypothetical protein
LIINADAQKEYINLSDSDEDYYKLLNLETERDTEINLYTNEAT